MASVAHDGRVGAVRESRRGGGGPGTERDACAERRWSWRCRHKATSALGGRPGAATERGGGGAVRAVLGVRRGA